MAFKFSLASSFAIGAINGYKKDGVDDKLYYGSAVITSVFALMGEFDPIFKSSPPFASKLAPRLLAPPLVIGATMLNASFMGRAIRDMYE